MMLKNLKRLRKEYGVSQQKLADIVDVSQSSINKYENRGVEPDLIILIRLAEYFNTSIDYIVGRTDVRREIEETKVHCLNQREKVLLEKYRRLSLHKKDCVDLMVDSLNE